jgi:hypothetical protein
MQPVTPEFQKLLKETHRVTKKNCRHLEYLLKEIQVNGEKGLQNILIAEHRDIDNLTQRLSVVWTATDKIRTKGELIRSVKRYIEKRPFFLGIWKLLFSKLVTRIVIGFLTLSLSIIGADAIIGVVSRFIRWLFELIK